MIKLTHEQAERVDSLVQQLEEEYPNEGILDIILATMDTLKTIAFVGKLEPVQHTVDGTSHLAYRKVA